MKAVIFIFSICLVLVSFSIGPVHAQDDNETAYAIPLKGITIDGKLDDWPEKMAVYPIAWVSSSYKNTPPEGPEDLLASFSVGYDADTGVLYLAVVVQDDELVVRPKHPSNARQDVCEIYIDGDHSGGDDTHDVTGAQQYVMVPGPGLFNLSVQTNPDIRNGDIIKAEVQAAYLRIGKITTYEWAITIFLSYPDSRLKIEPGKIIGFDIAISDADGNENGNWVAWSPKAGKHLNSDCFGKLIFVQNYKNLDVMLGPVAPAFLMESYCTLDGISGRVTNKYNGSSRIGIEIRVDDDKGKPNITAMTDKNGRYNVIVTPGEYLISVSEDKKLNPVKVTVNAGEYAQNINFSPDLGAISGKVTDKLDDSPLPFVEVRIHDLEGKLKEWAETNSEGKYKAWVAPGSYRVSMADAKDEEFVEVSVKAGEETHNIDFELEITTRPYYYQPSNILPGVIIIIGAGYILLLGIFLLKRKYEKKLNRYVIIALCILIYLAVSNEILIKIVPGNNYAELRFVYIIFIFLAALYWPSLALFCFYRKYESNLYRIFFITGIVLSTFLTMNVILFGASGFDFLFGVGILGAVALLLYPKYKVKLTSNLKIMIYLALFPGSIVTYLLFFTICFFVIINFPKEKPFEEKIKPLSITQSETDAYGQYISLTQNVSISSEVEDVINTSRNGAAYDTLMIRQTILDAYPDIEQILDFASENIISTPESLYTYDAPLPKYSPMISSLKAELFLITTLLANKEYDTASQKYLRLWNVLDHQLSGKQGLVGTMIGVVLTGILVDFQINHHDELHLNNFDEIINVVRNIVDNIDQNMKNNINIEPLFARNLINSILTNPYKLYEAFGFDIEELELLPPGIIKRAIKWPFYDYYKFLRIHDEFFHATNLLITQPLFKSEKSFKKHEELGENLIYFDVFWRYPLLALMNPSLPNFTNLIRRKEMKKSELIALLYLMETRGKEEFCEPPIDNLTGKPFMVIADNYILEIKSEYGNQETMASKSIQTMITMNPFTKLHEPAKQYFRGDDRPPLFKVSRFTVKK